jgi:hypothetical protein
MLGILALTLSLASLTACAAIARHHEAFAHEVISQTESTDPISGEWIVSFFVHDDQKTPATFNLSLTGTTVTGTAYSDHTGLGTIREGVWEKGKLTFTLDFKNHESIAITGALQGAKLAGEFRTEGFVAKWEALKK